MLGRHMVGYAPSLIVTGIVSLASLTFFTHLMSQAEYGQYSLAVAMMTMLIGVCFSWLQNAMSRLLPQAVAEAKERQFMATIYSVFAVSGVVVMIFAAAVMLFLPLNDWRVAAWFAPPLAILRALLNINQAIHRNFVRITRYNIIEIGQSLIGLAAALALMIFLGRGASEAAWGLAIGLAAMSLFDWRMLGAMRRADFDKRIFGDILHFGLPFVANFGFSFILAGSDRFLIEQFLGPAQVGIYSAGYAFPDRIGQYLFMAVATASFPLVVRRMEHEGVEAAREQTYANGVALLALAMPACIGMLLLNHEIASTMIGRDFRAGAITVMPIIAMATIFNGMAAHYFDHALHLAKKTRLFFFTLGPAAVFNLAANIYAIPRFGIVGAAWTTLVAYAIYMALSIIVGRRVFRIAFPFVPALQIAAVTGVMALALSAFSVRQDLLGLVTKVVVGAAVYGWGMLSFDIMGARSYLESRFKLSSGEKETVSARAGLLCEIVSDSAAIEALVPEWRALHRRASRSVFGDYDWFLVWQRHFGAGAQVHIATGRAISGELKALLPLVVRRKGFLRFLEWAGYEVFDFGDVLTQSDYDADSLWRFVHEAGGYDVALMKDVLPSAASLAVLKQLMQPRAQHLNYYLTLDFASGDAWLAAQSRKFRGDIRRKAEKMQGRGDVAFHAWPKGDLVPSAVVDAIYTQKAAWLKERGGKGLFTQAAMNAFLHELAHQAARDENLYLAWLTCGEAIIACHMGFVRDGVLYLYLTTFDAEFGAFSPGNILMVETIKAAIDGKLRELDFMRGDESYKQRFSSGTRLLSAFVLGRSWIGRLLVSLRNSSDATIPSKPDSED